MSLNFWEEAFEIAVYNISRPSLPYLNNMSHLENFFNQKPNYKFMKTFGCAAFPYLRPYQNDKFNFHTFKCVLLGYSNDYKGFKCMHNSSSIYIVVHVTLNEN